jgi:hypothetical protein
VDERDCQLTVDERGVRRSLTLASVSTTHADLQSYRRDVGVVVEIQTMEGLSSVNESSVSALELWNFGHRNCVGATASLRLLKRDDGREGEAWHSYCLLQRNNVCQTWIGPGDYDGCSDGPRFFNNKLSKLISAASHLKSCFNVV